MAAQETAHMLLSMPLTGCTYNFVTVSLDNTRKVVIDNENHTGEVLQKSTIEEYGKCSTPNSRCQGLSQLNLMQCVTVDKISITGKETISPLYCADIPKGVGKPSRA